MLEREWSMEMLITLAKIGAVLGCLLLLLTLICALVVAVYVVTMAIDSARAELKYRNRQKKYQKQNDELKN